MKQTVAQIFSGWIAGCTSAELKAIEENAKKSAIKWFLMSYIPIIGIIIAYSGNGLLSYNFYRFVKTKGRDNQTIISFIIRLFFVCSGMFIIGPFFAGLSAGSGRGRKVVGLDKVLGK